nr:ABC transporter permease [Candidatus Nanopelagicales bacterium]
SLTVRGGLRIPTVVIALVLALSATALAAWWPARRAMRIMPAEAMRGEVPATTHSRSWMERIVPGSRHFNAKWRLILRNIGRSGARSAFTAIGVALSIMLVLSTIGLYTSMSNLIDVEFGSVIRNDGQVEFATAVTDDQLRQVHDVKDVQDVETAISEPVSVADGSDVYATTLTGLDKDTSMHGFITKKGDPVELPSSGFLVDQSVTAQLPDLAVGDQITVTLTGAGLDDTKIKGKVEAFAFEPLGAYIYADKSWLADQAPEAQASDVLLTTTDGADQDTVRKDVSKIPGALVYVDTASLLDTVLQYEALFNAIAIVMMILGAIMAFAIIFTTMSVSIFERYREIATFRAAGVKFSTIASTVRWENIIVSLFGVVPGIILGVIGAAALGRSLSSDEYTIALSLPWLAVLLVVLGVLLVALFSQVPGMLRVRHMSVADVVRERAQ